MKEQNNWLKKVVDIVLKLVNAFLSNSKTTQNSEDLAPSRSESLSEAAKGIATDFLANKAIGLVNDFGGMLSKLSPKQKDYAYKMAVLKSAHVSELNWDELDMLSNQLNEAAQLGLEITEELSTFWSKFASVASEVAQNSLNVGVKLAAKSIVPFMPF